MTALDTIIHQADAFVCNDDCGYLTLGWRNRISDALRDEFPTDWRMRRAVLAYLAAQETIPWWQSLGDLPLGFESLPMEILAKCRETIFETITHEESSRSYFRYDHLTQECFGAYASLRELNFDNWPTHAPYAALAALHQATWPDYDWGDYGAEDAESTRRDAHCLACADFVGVTAGAPELAGASRKYWLHWLHDLLPRVTGDFEQVLSELSAG